MGWGTTLSKTRNLPKKSRAAREQPSPGPSHSINAPLARTKDPKAALSSLQKMPLPQLRAPRPTNQRLSRISPARAQAMQLRKKVRWSGLGRKGLMTRRKSSCYVTSSTEAVLANSLLCGNGRLVSRVKKICACCASSIDISLRSLKE